MPIGDYHIKECNCCGKISISYELFFLCSECSHEGHSGFSNCPLCKKIEAETGTTKKQLRKEKNIYPHD